jgi:uncharacterized protein YcbK (DUF882 family)
LLKAAPVFALVLAAGVALAPVAVVNSAPSPYVSTAALAGPLAPAIAALAAERERHVALGVELELYNVNTRETLKVTLTPEGALDDAAAKAISHFLRCKRTGRERTIDPGVLRLFATVVATFPGHVVEVVSGVRARGFGARESKHYTGHAIDFRIRGVSTKRVREVAWSLDDAVGVGHYHEEDFLHLDHRPGEGRIAWDQRRPGSKKKYHPRWAGRLRSEQPRW